MQDESVIQARKSMIQDNSFMQAIRLPANAGLLLSGYIVASHAGALILLLHTGMPLALQLWGCAAVSLHAGYLLVRHSPRLNRHLPRQVLLTPAGDWWLIDGEGRSRQAALMADAFIHPRLLILRFRGVGDILHAIIEIDAHNTDQLRRLRVRLWHGMNIE